MRLGAAGSEAIRMAEGCSGIRSTMALVLTAVLASQILFKDS